MAGFLAYWKDYWQRSKAEQVVLDWATDSKSFYDAVCLGDTIWGVISGPDGKPGEWRLLEAVVVKSKNARSTTKYGRYYFVPDKLRSRRFKLERQPDLAAVLWLMEFRSGRHIRLAGASIGQALQSNGARKLSYRDVALLEEYADALVEMGAMSN